MNIILNVCFVKIWGANGLAFGTTLSTLLSIFAMLFYLKWEYKSFKISELAEPSVKMFIGSVCMIVVLTVVKVTMKRVIVDFRGTLIYLITCTCVGVVIYFGSLMLQKEKNALELWNKIKC